MRPIAPAIQEPLEICNNIGQRIAPLGLDFGEMRKVGKVFGHDLLEVVSTVADIKFLFIIFD